MAEHERAHGITARIGQMLQVIQCGPVVLQILAHGKEAGAVVVFKVATMRRADANETGPGRGDDLKMCGFRFDLSRSIPHRHLQRVLAHLGRREAELPACRSGHVEQRRLRIIRVGAAVRLVEETGNVDAPTIRSRDLTLDVDLRWGERIVARNCQIDRCLNGLKPAESCHIENDGVNGEFPRRRMLREFRVSRGCGQCAGCSQT